MRLKGVPSGPRREKLWRKGSKLGPRAAEVVFVAIPDKLCRFEHSSREMLQPDEEDVKQVSARRYQSVLVRVEGMSCAIACSQSYLRRKRIGCNEGEQKKKRPGGHSSKKRVI